MNVLRLSAIVLCIFLASSGHAQSAGQTYADQAQGYATSSAAAATQAYKSAMAAQASATAAQASSDYAAFVAELDGTLAAAAEAAEQDALDAYNANPNDTTLQAYQSAIAATDAAENKA